MAPDPDPSPLLPPEGKKEVQSVQGSLLYYARSVDPTMLPGLNEISGAQAKPTILTHKKLLVSLTTQPRIPTPSFVSSPAA